MHGKKVATCPRHDKYPGGGSETFSVQAELLHIWRCRHEYNPPTPTPTEPTLLLCPSSPCPSHATNFHPVLHEGNEAASERDFCPRLLLHSPSFVACVLPLYSWWPIPPANFFSLFSFVLQFSPMIVGVWKFFPLFIFCFKMKDNTRE